jgi:ankyrin repeat protein
LVGATPFWLAARFSEPGVMRLLVKHGADPLFVHHSDEVASKGFKHKTEVTTALMAAVGMGGGTTTWVQPARGDREALTLEAVKLALDYGVDVNAAGTDGSTALDAAKALRYEKVVEFLAAKGARANHVATKKQASRE